MPTEYCQFGEDSIKLRCIEWLQKTHPNVSNVPDQSKVRLGPDAGIVESLSELQVSTESGTQPQPAPPKKDKKQGVSKPKQCTVQTIDRNKRKRVTVITNLDFFGVDLKKAAKIMAGKFACGAAVTKEAAGDEIHIQGDFSADVVELLKNVFKLEGTNVVLLDPKKK